MIFRAAAIALTLVCATGAYAEEPAPAETAAPATQYAPEHLAAAHDFYSAVIFDNGMLEQIFQTLEADSLPDLRTRIERSQIYREAPPARRQALMNIIDNLPTYLRQELTAALVEIGDRVAPRFAERMTEEELRQTATFMRSEEMRPAWEDLAETVTDRDKPTPNFPNWRRVGSFAETPAGQAFGRESPAMSDMLTEESDLAMQMVFPRLLTVIAGQLCDALAEDCPPQMRETAGRT